MATLKDEAKAYEPPQTLNIADLDDKIAVNIELKNGEGKDKDGEVFTYKYIEVNKKQYRVPNSVIGGIKALLEKRPNMEYFQVLRSGSGMNTRYSVIPYTD